MKKRLSALILAMLMILSICPVAMAEDAAVSTASAYDVHITGNYVEGETLTANYTYYDPSGNAPNEEAVVYKWYYAKLDSTEALTPIEGATGKTLTVTSDMIATTWVSSNIFVSVQTASVEDAEGVVGEPVYSRFYDRIIQKEIPSGKPAAYGAYIMPKNPQNTTNEGDTLAAYFTYVDADKVSAGNHLYEWYTYESLSDTEPETVQAESTNGTYVIKAEDFGKYIGCKVTPVNANGVQGTPITTKNHTGNLFYSPDVVTTFERAGDYGNGSYYNLNPYPAHQMLADGGEVESYTPPRQAGTVMVARNAGAAAYDAGVIFDIGEAKPFNGFYFKVKTAATSPTDMTFSYSLTGEAGSWTDMASFTAAAGETEKLLSSTAQARYFKFDYSTTKTGIQIAEFYPIVTQDAKVTVKDEYSNLMKVSEEEVSPKIVVYQWGTPSSDILEGLERTSAVDSTKVSAKLVNSSNEEINPFNVTEDLTNTYLLVTGANGITTKYEIVYSGDILNTVGEKAVDIKEKTPIVDNKTFPSAEGGFLSLSYKVYVPEGVYPAINCYSNGTTWNSSNTAAIQNVIKFADTGKIEVYGNKNTNYNANKWYDVEIIFDYSTVKTSGAVGKICSYVWVDGVELVNNYIRDFNVPAKFRYDHFHADISSSKYDGMKVSDVIFRQVHKNEVKSRVNKEYRSVLVNADDTENTPVESLSPNKEYKLVNGIGVYTANSYEDYLAVFNVTYDGGTEVSRTLDSVVKGSDLTATIAESVDNGDGTVTKQEVRAFCFSDTLVPLTKMGEWK